MQAPSPALAPTGPALAPTGHALLSPSSAKKWLNCPGSIALEQAVGVKDSSSEYADYGTACHHLAAVCLTEGANAADYLGRTVALWSSESTGNRGTDFLDQITDASGTLIDFNIGLGRQFEVDADMVSMVQTYLDTVRSYVGDGTLLVEQKLSIEHLTAEPGAFGTSDAVIIRGDELIVIDLKTGSGIEVDADRNEQLMIYASAALAAYESGKLILPGVAPATADDLLGAAAALVPPAPGLDVDDLLGDADDLL